MNRSTILTRLFHISNTWYRKFKKNQPWQFTVNDLLNLPKGTIGSQLGHFLRKHNFNLLAKSERHDVYHVVTGFGTSVPEEITMQFYLLGNGKRSLYLFGVIGLGAISYPEHWSKFKKAFQYGKQALPFYALNYEQLLLQNLSTHQKDYAIHHPQLF